MYGASKKEQDLEGQFGPLPLLCRAALINVQGLPSKLGNLVSEIAIRLRDNMGNTLQNHPVTARKCQATA